MKIMDACRSKLFGAVVFLVALAPMVLVSSCQAQPPKTANDSYDAVSQLRADIQFLDVVNRMSLSPQQAEALIDVAGRAQQVSMKFNNDRDAAVARLQPLLEQQLGFMLQDQPVSDKLIEQIDNAEAAVEQVEAAAQQASLPFAAETRKILTQDQILIATGGDEARRTAEEMLVWIRELSDEDFNSDGRANAEALAAPDIELGVDQIMDIFRKTRALPASEYAEQIGTLAAELAPLWASNAEGEDSMLAEFISTERFVTVMQRRIKYLSTDGGEG